MPRIMMARISVAINVRIDRAIGNIKYYFAAGGRADAC